MSSAKEIMQTRAYRYAEDALSGKVLAPKTVKQQAGHFLEDLKKAETGRFRYVYDTRHESLKVD